MHRDRRFLVTTLAAAILGVRWDKNAVGQAIGAALKTESQLCEDLADSVVSGWTIAYPPSPDQLADMLWQDDSFHELCEAFETRPVHIRVPLGPPCFNPAAKFADLDIPRLVTSRDLSDWLGVDISRLHWLADSRRTAANTHIPILQNYRYSFAAKRHGAARVIEAPKPELMAIQKRVLRGILDYVPVHDAAHGFVRGRSPLSSAQVHGGEDVVITCDLKDFFLSTPVRRVHGLFRSLGYPWTVSRLLTGLCTAAMPSSVFRRLPLDQRHDRQTQAMYAASHLPAGAPTSPVLANLAAFALDCRLFGLANRFGAAYTRYADDMVFSGGKSLGRRSEKFLAIVSEIAVDEGYVINSRKTRVMPRSVRQQVTGIVVNSHNNIARAEYDRLKAILLNCVRNGGSAENRDGHADFRAHLDGRVTWAENVNPYRARKLRALFEQIVWE